MPRRLRIREFFTALALSGSSGQSVDCGADFIGTGDFTFCGWINPSTLGENSAAQIVSNGAQIITMIAPNTVRASADNGSTVAKMADNAIKFNQWQFIAVTRRRSGANAIINLYLNGALSGSADQAGGTINSPTTNLILGSNAAGTRDFAGSIDTFRFFNREFSAAEIENLFYEGRQVNDSPSSALSAEYLFNEGGGTVATDTGPYGRNGTISGGTFTPNVPMHERWAIRNFGASLDFAAGSTDLVDCGADFIGAGDVTVCAWINARGLGTSNGGRIIDNGRLGFGITSGTRRLRLLSDGSTAAVSDPVGLNFNQWMFVAATRTAAGVTNLFINGYRSGTPDQSSGTPAAGTTNVILGNVAAGNRTWNGKLARIRVYKTILNAAEIRRLFIQGDEPNGSPGSLLAARYPLNEGSGSTATDTGPYARNGTITGALYSTDVPLKERTRVTTRKKVVDDGTSIYFDGLTAIGNITGGSAPLVPATSDITIAVQVKLAFDSQAGIRFFSRFHGDSTSRAPYFAYSATQGYQFTVRGSVSGTMTVNSMVMRKGVWVDLVGTWNKTTGDIKLYVDGQLAGTPQSLIESAATGSTRPGFMNSLDGGATPSKGWLKWGRVWSRELSAAEVAAYVYNRRTPREGLVAEWPYDDLDSTIRDTSGYNNVGTYSGGYSSSLDVPSINRTKVI